MATYPDIALREGSWRICTFHHVGPGATSLCTASEPFIALLNALYDRREKIWIDTNTNIQKYVTERDAVSITIEETSDDAVRLCITAGLDTWLYNHPLTVRTNVPVAWNKCLITQCGKRQTVKTIDGVAQYEAFPDCGPIFIKKYYERFFSFKNNSMNQ